MAIDTVPPWLRVEPSDFVKAGQMGAEAGLAARRQYSSEVEAGDRLRLAYDTLASQERRESERVAAQQELAAMKLDYQMQQNEAALALREQQAAALNAYRDARLNQYDTAEQRRQEAAASLEDYRRNRLDQFQQGLDISADKAKAMIQRGEATPISFPELPGLTFIKQPNGNILKVQSPASTPRVTYDMQTGTPKTISGPYNSPVIQNLLNPPAPPVTPPEEPGLLSRAWNTLTGGGVPEVKPIIPGAPAPTTGTLPPPEPAAALLPSPAAGTAPSGRVFVDKTGTRWIYTGTADDPKTDQNPDHWAQQ